MAKFNAKLIYEEIIHYMNEKLPYYQEITCKSRTSAFYDINSITTLFRYDRNLRTNPDIDFDYHYIVGNFAQTKYITVQQKGYVYSIRFVRYYNSNKILISGEIC